MKTHKEEIDDLIGQIDKITFLGNEIRECIKDMLLVSYLRGEVEGLREAIDSINGVKDLDWD